GNEDIGPMTAAAGCLEHAPCPLDVALERGQRAAVGDANNRVGRQMEDGLHLVLGESAFEQRLILDTTADNVDAGNQAGPGQLRAAHLIAHQPDDVSAALDEGPCGPGTDQAGTPSDEDPTVAP